MKAQASNMTKTSVAQQAKTASLLPPVHGILQRKCACGNDTIAGGECAECKQKTQALQRASLGSQERGMVRDGEIPPIVHEVMRSPGRPLDVATRAFMEPRFERDFSQVRLHTGAKAAESARAVNALAYTMGQNVVFGTGQYQPAGAAGMHLIAHELAHVVQQGRGLHARSSGVMPANDAAEQEAEASATKVMAGHSVGQLTDCGQSIQRQVSPDDFSEVLKNAEEAVAAAKRETQNTPPGGPPKAPLVVACDDVQRKLATNAFANASSWVNRAIGALNVMFRFRDNPNFQINPLPDVTAALRRHFQINPYQPNADKVRANLQRIRDGIAGGLSYSCDPAGCFANASIDLITHEVHLCRPFFEKSSDAGRVQTLVHEAAHVFAYSHSPQKDEVKATDRALAGQRVYTLLTPDDALNNADSYGAFVVDVANPRDTVKEPPKDTFEGCPPEAAQKVRETITQVEQWNTQAIDVLSRTLPREVEYSANWRKQYFGNADPGQIPMHKDRYFQVNFKLNAGIPFRCEPRCNNDTSVGYFSETVTETNYLLFKNESRSRSDVLHLCPVWLSTSQSPTQRIWNLYRLALRTYADVPETMLDNYVGFARTIAEVRLPELEHPKPAVGK